MKIKDCYAILGILMTECGYVFIEDERPAPITLHDKMSEEDRYWFLINIIDYLRGIKMSYTFVRDILTDRYGSPFYHNGYGHNKLPKQYMKNKKTLYTSDYDYVQIDETGRIGIWCEVDGFVAWLDEYRKYWIVDTRKEVKERLEQFNETISKIYSESIEKVLKNVKIEMPECKTIKVHRIVSSGLEDYKREEKKK